MNTSAIAVINGQQIQVSNDEAQLVPIKPICDALGIDDRAQRQKISEDEFLSSTGVLSTLVAADGKQREMFCLPLKYVYGWLFTINPKNVSDEARPAVMRYRVECYNALYDRFNRQAKRVAEENRAEIEALEEIARITQEMGETKQHLAEAKKRLESIRAGRLDSQPSLFD